MLKSLICFAAFAGILLGQSGIEGTWQGTLDVGAVKLRLALHISKNAAGEFTSTFDSLDQGAMGIPAAATTFSANTLHVELASLHATYDGTLNAAANEITGRFVQGAPFPLVLKRVDKIEPANRPQTPKAPFPYEAVDVAYEPAAGIKLAGTLTVPHGQGPFPAALLITGSGPQDRDETLFEHKPFWVMADYLTRRGIAILRVDDRGVGGSSGNSTRETLDDMAADVVAGVGFLKTRKEIDGRHIGVIGHSEGGLVGPAAAVRSPDIAFVVMLAGTGVAGDELLKAQGEAVIRSAGGSDADVAEQRRVQEMIFRILRAEPDDTAAVEKMRAAWKEMKPAEQASDQAVVAQFKRVTSPEMRSFILYDPALTLKKLKAPVLALNGSRDIQVPPRQNLPAIVAALAEGGNSDFAVSELPGLNHLFQKCQKCTVAEYGSLEETFSPVALEIMGNWIVRHK